MASAVLLCVAGLAAAVGVRLSEERTPWRIAKGPAWARSLPLPSDRRITVLRKRLLKAAAEMGESHPTRAMIVVTRRQRFYRATGMDIPHQPNDILYVIAASGHFVSLRGPPQQGTFMFAYRGADRRGETGGGLESEPPTDLRKLGRTILLDLDS